jgi:hypothetical protein
MHPPKNIEYAILELLTFGILLARGTADSGNLWLCQLETEHIHNLPHLIDEYSDHRLMCYYEATMRGYMERTKGIDRDGFKPYWKTIEMHLKDAGLLERTEGKFKDNE